MTMKSLGLYRWSVFLTAFAGVLSLAPSQESLAGPAGFLVISAGLWWVRGKARLLPARGWKARLAVFLLPVCLFLLAFALGPTPMAAVVSGSVILIAFRFFTAARPLHYFEVLALALAQVVYACSLPPHPLFLLVLLYFLAAWVFALLMLHLVEESRGRIALLPQDRPPQSDPLEQEIAFRKGGNRVLGYSAAFAAALVPLAAVFFVLLPRTHQDRPQVGNPAGARRRLARPDVRDRDRASRTRPFPSTEPYDGPGGADERPSHLGFAGEIDLGTW